MLWFAVLGGSNPLGSTNAGIVYWSDYIALPTRGEGFDSPYLLQNSDIGEMET